MTNGLLKYTSKDFESIKADLIDSISSLTNTWTSREESDPGIVILKCMSALGDMLSYNFDKQVLEYYAPTVTQRKNAYRLFQLIGYHMHWYTSAMTTVTLTYNAPMPEYMTYVKEMADAESEDAILDAYYNYRNRYRQDAVSVDPHIISLSIPPVTEYLTGVPFDLLPEPLPQPMIDAGEHRFSRDIGGEGDYSQLEPLPEDIKMNENFIEHAYRMKESAVNFFNIWKKDNVSAFGLHTYINDPYKTLEIYSSDSNSVIYSLLPETENVSVDQNGLYNPTVYLEPFTPTKLKAIQGVLKQTTFTGNHIKNNKYYIPESNVDEDHMYVSYITEDSNQQQQNPVFLKKTDNLLTETEIKDDQGNTIIYFQFGVDDFDYPYIEFSSYWNTELESSSVKFTFYYFKTLGKYGNITNNYLKRISTYSGANISVENVDNNTSSYDENGDILGFPGQNIETAREAYVNSLNYVMTYNTLVTVYDFERYTKRQHSITNALAVDIQRAIDFNTDLLNDTTSLSESQLREILGETDTTKTKSQLVNALCNIRKVVYNPSDSIVLKDSAYSTVFDPSNSDGTFKSYKLHMYPVYENFKTADSTGTIIAKITNSLDQGDSTLSLPYKLYRINTSDDGVPEEQYSVATALSKAYRDCHIVNVDPSFTALRVFPWRCCGVIHLTKTVNTIEAQSIVENVINAISSIYNANNIEFGTKINYMDLIQVIMNADTRIRYFDAGMGSKKLVVFENCSNNPENYFNVEAYFNKESLMQYVQTARSNFDKTSEYYNWISIDPAYIQTNVNS